MLAAKCESSVLPEITCTDVVFSADNTFGSQDMEAAEENLLSCLQWKLAIPTIFDFVELYSEILGIQNDQSLSSRRILCMMRYLSELVVQTTIHSSFLPSMVSSCIVVLSLFRLKDEANALGANLWPDQMVEITGYSWKSLEGCFNTMSPLLNDIFNTMPDLTIISRRYQKAIRENVASVHIPIITSFTELTTYREEQRRQLCLSASATSTDSTG